MIISGIVLHGLGKGKELGFPTMNVDPAVVPKELSFGEYIVRVKTPVGEFKGAMHYGPRPAVNAPLSCEVHALGLNEDLYGESITITVGKKIREVGSFSTLEELKKAIRNDLKLVEESGDVE